MKRPSLAGARAALVVMALALLLPAGRIGLLEPTETRYAEIAREMVATGDWLVPRLNGISHFHKPPLSYWAIAGGLATLGPNGWGARVPVAIASWLTLALAALAARRRFASLGLAAGPVAWILGSSALFFAIGRTLASDPFLTAAIAGFWAFAPSPWALFALGLGFLAKGPVVLVPTVLAVLVAAALGRERGTLALLGPAWGWLPFAIAGLGWFVAVALFTPGLIGYLLEFQVWDRIATPIHQRPGPAWYFAAVVIVGALPWTPAAIAGAIHAWRARGEPNARLLLAWALVPPLFLSFSASKLPAYVLPATPAVAMLAALGLARGGRAVRWWVAALLALLALGGWVAGPAALGDLAGLEPSRALALPWALHLALALLALAAVPMIRGRVAQAGALAVAGLVAMLLGVAPLEARLGSPRRMVELLAGQRAPDEPVVEYARFNAGLPFYLGETVRLLDVPRETGFDEPARTRAILLTRAGLDSLVERHRRLWLFGPEAPSESLAVSLGRGWRPIARWNGGTLGLIVP